MSPINREPVLIFSAPTQTIKMVVKLMISMIPGIMKDMMRCRIVLLSRTSMLTPLNLSACVSCALNARMTRIPVRFSRAVRFSLSVSFCTRSKRGVTKVKIEAIMKTSRGMTTAKIHDMLEFSALAFWKPMIAYNGAETTILSIIVIIIWTCWTSLVLRVIKEAVEYLSNSISEKFSIFR